jgi:hypothetical protein
MAKRYAMKINEYIKYLDGYRKQITKQQYDTFKGKLKQGDILAVRKGLTAMLKCKD